MCIRDRDEGDASTSAGDEVIDVGLYYGSEDVIAAKSIRYVQLKHSSRQAQVPWTASGLKGTIEGFAARFEKLEASLGLDALVSKVQFIFLTNRPMAVSYTHLDVYKRQTLSSLTSDLTS